MSGGIPQTQCHQFARSASSDVNSSSSNNKETTGVAGSWIPANSPPASPPGTPLRHKPTTSEAGLPTSEPPKQPPSFPAMSTPRHHNTSSSTTNNGRSPYNNATPRTYNGKRRLPNALPNSSVYGRSNSHVAKLSFSEADEPQNGEHESNSSISTTTSTSSFDCQSLQHSLKRVRLSSSPGELRLSSDLRQLANGDWRQVQEDGWDCPSTGIRLERCGVDPLRLTLVLPAAEDTVECTLQVPRMYPHNAPAITKLSKASIRQQPLYAAPSAGSDQQELQISRSFHSSLMASNRNQVALLEKFAEDMKSSVCRGWSPIMQLSDVLDYLVECLQAGRATPFPRAASLNSGMMIHPLVVAEASREEDSSVNSAAACDVAMMMTTPGSTTRESEDGGCARLSTTSFLSPNRFDVGYRRSPPPQDGNNDQIMFSVGIAHVEHPPSSSGSMMDTSK